MSVEELARVAIVGVLTSAVIPTQTCVHPQHRPCWLLVWSPMGWRLSQTHVRHASHPVGDSTIHIWSIYRMKRLGWLCSEVCGRIRQCVSICWAGRLPGLLHVSTEGRRKAQSELRACLQRLWLVRDQQAVDLDSPRLWVNDSNRQRHVIQNLKKKQKT